MKVMKADIDDNDIRELFGRISSRFESADDGTKEMLAMLVNTTLKYRETLEHASGIPLTVGETRSALDAFMSVMQTRRIPDGLNKRIRDLLLLWLEELKLRVHN
ncbi:MAG TPA: hypothetical protein PLT05_02055 [bacterium]|nr:hypothetical protein [bacterium]HQG13127.1 hypothetical protein [bacterium]HQH80053.1 hypothetical protein [bacterium]